MININENQAVQIAVRWLKEERKTVLPLKHSVFVPAVKAGGEEGYLFDKPESWLIVFSCDVPQGFHPNEVFVLIDPETGAVEAPPMM